MFKFKENIRQAVENVFCRNQPHFIRKELMSCQEDGRKSYIRIIVKLCNFCNYMNGNNYVMQKENYF